MGGNDCSDHSKSKSLRSYTFQVLPNDPTSSLFLPPIIQHGKSEPRSMEKKGVYTRTKVKTLSPDPSTTDQNTSKGALHGGTYLVDKREDGRTVLGRMLRHNVTLELTWSTHMRAMKQTEAIEPKGTRRSTRGELCIRSLNRYGQGRTASIVFEGYRGTTSIAYARS
jgi:hypothetical protein